MKKLLVVVLTILMAIYSIPVIGAENEPLETGMFFGSEADCKSAYENQNFRFYLPDPVNLKKVPNLAKGLPRAGCALEDVRENKAWSPAWVILAPNTPVVFGADGVPILDGRCHNKIHRFLELPLLRGLPGTNGINGTNGLDGYTPVKGKDYFDGKNGENFSPPPSTTGWCGIFRTNAGCNWATGILVAIGTGIAIASGGGSSSSKKPNSGETGPATARFPGDTHP